MSQFRVAHLTTVDLSLRFLVRPQLQAVIEAGGEAVGISAPGPWVAELTETGMRHIPLTASTRGVSPLNDLRAAIQLWRVLRKESFTVLHTHNPKPGLYGRVLGRIARVPLVVNTMHGFYATEDDPLLKRTLVYLLEAIAARFSDVELHQNPEDLELARRLHILPRGKGVLLGNGVDLSRFDPDRLGDETRERIRADLGVRDGQVLVGIVGRLVAEKGYPELFEAVAGLDERYRLAVVGPDDPEKADALPRGMIASASENGVLFLGMRTDVDDLYSAMDVFVLPSHREGFPRAAMEAAAMGLPIVATDIRGCREVVAHGVNGLLVPVNDPPALRNAIATVGDEEATRFQMGRASRTLALEKFDERRVVEIVMSSYTESLSTKGLGHLLPEQSSGDMGPSPVRSATVADARALAGMHLTELNTGFLPRLGHRFMSILYEALIEWPDATVFVVDDQVGPVGYVTGVVDTGEFYRYFLRKFGIRAAIAAFPRVILNLRRAFESFRYGSEDNDVRAELLSLAVARRARGRGLSTSLGTKLLEALSIRGCDTVKVVVAEENATAIGAYEKLGFIDQARIEVHRGEFSRVMVWHH
jgi:glycosyltransferase involved in cell wall biosynthesis/ribosomal protein S18 acetylase RimI-like enzyme